MPKVTGKPSRTRSVVSQVATAPLQPALEWERRDIRIQKVVKGVWTPYSLTALCYGNLAIFPDLFGTDRWSVTCLPLGCRLVLLDSDEDAAKVAEHLQAVCGDALAGGTQSEVRNALPQWVPDWCYAMRKSGKWQSPPHQPLPPPS